MNPLTHTLNQSQQPPLLPSIGVQLSSVSCEIGTGSNKKEIFGPLWFATKSYGKEYVFITCLF